MRFIQIHDIAQLAARMTAADWRELLDEDANAYGIGGCSRHSRSFRVTCPGGVSPAPVLAKLRSLCPRRLRDRYERVTVYEVARPISALRRYRASSGRAGPAMHCDWRVTACGPRGSRRGELAATLVVQPLLMQVRWV